MKQREEIPRNNEFEYGKDGCSNSEEMGGSLQRTSGEAHHRQIGHQGGLRMAVGPLSCLTGMGKICL